MVQLYRLALPRALKLPRLFSVSAMHTHSYGHRRTLLHGSHRALFCLGDLQHLRLAPPSQPTSQPASQAAKHSERVVSSSGLSTIGRRAILEAAIVRCCGDEERLGRGCENYFELLGDGTIYTCLLGVVNRKVMTL